MSIKNTDEHYRLYQEIAQLRRDVHALAVLQLSAAIRMSGQNDWDAYRISQEALSMVQQTVSMVNQR